MRKFKVEASLEAEIHSTFNPPEGDATATHVGSMRHPVLGEFTIGFMVSEPPRLVIVDRRGRSAIINVRPILEALAPKLSQDG